MARWGSPASGSLAQPRAPAPPADRRPPPGRAALASLALAWASLAGIVSACVALAPLALRRGPSRSPAPADDAPGRLGVAAAPPQR